MQLVLTLKQLNLVFACIGKSFSAAMSSSFIYISKMYFNLINRLKRTKFKIDYVTTDWLPSGGILVDIILKF